MKNEFSQSVETASRFTRDAVTATLVTGQDIPDGVKCPVIGKLEILSRFNVVFCNQLLVFQQHQDESLYDSWTRFKDVIRKVMNHGLSIWIQIEIFLKHIDSLSRHIINLIAKRDLRKLVILDHEEIGLNCNHNTPFNSREVPSFDRPEPQPLLNSPSLDVSLGDVIGPEPPIKPHSSDSSKMKVVDYLTTQTLPSPHVVIFDDKKLGRS
nr:zinc finger, CCHC-type [Tanacetum cinerariifolium]